MSDKKVLNLEEFRKRRAEVSEAEMFLDSEDQNLFESVIDDATTELIQTAVNIAKDLDIAIDHDSFAIYVSTAAGYFKKSLRVGFGLDEWKYKEGQEGDIVKAVLRDLHKDDDE
jgi:hypothetical protein